MLPEMQESLLLPLGRARIPLHVRRVVRQIRGPVAVLIHGLFEDGALFCGDNQQNLAQTLALKGYDVYVIDLRGKGRKDSIQNTLRYDIHEVLSVDLPALVSMIEGRRGVLPELWVGQGTGCLLLTAALAEHEHWRLATHQIIQFGPQSHVRLSGWDDFVWRWGYGKLLRIVSRMKGAILSKSWRLGDSDECAHFYESIWHLYEGNTELELETPPLSLPQVLYTCQHWPRTLYFSADSGVFGRLTDVRAFIQMLPNHDAQVMVSNSSLTCVELIKSNKAIQAHLPTVVDWLTFAEA